MKKKKKKATTEIFHKLKYENIQIYTILNLFRFLRTKMKAKVRAI